MLIIRQLPRAIPIALAVLLLAAVTSEVPAGSSPHASISQVERVDLETDIPSYRIVDLGAFGSPGSQAYSAAYGLNERGDVVGVAQDDDWAGSPFLYRNGELIDIGSINLEYRSGTAKAVNARGQIAGRSIGWSPYPKFPTWVNRPFLATPRGGPGDAVPGIGIDGEAFGINNRGQMAVTLNLVPTIRVIPRAHFWDPKTGLHEIEFPSQPEGAEDGSSAWAINQHGQVVGSYEGEDLAPHAYIWNSHTNEVVDLHILSAAASGAYAINNRGDVAGWFEAQGLHYVIIWTHDGRIVSPPALLDPTLPSGTAEGINNRGDVVGWYVTEQDLDPLAWVMFDAVDGEFPNGYPESIALADLLEESDRAEWELWYAYEINDARQIVGLGIHHGLIRGFLMTPDTLTPCDVPAYPAYENEGAARAVLELRGPDGPMFAPPEDYDRAVRDLGLIAAEYPYLDPASGWRDDLEEHTLRLICGIDTEVDRSGFDRRASCQGAEVRELFDGDMVFVDFLEPVNPDAMASLYAEDPSVRYCETTGDFGVRSRGHHVERDYGNGWWLWAVRVTWGEAGNWGYDCDYVYRFYSHPDHDRVYLARWGQANPDTSKSRLSAAECGNPDPAMSSD